MTYQEQYIVLSSNSNRNLENPSEFTIHLPRRLSFDHDDVLGLSDISFNRSFESISNLHQGCILFAAGSIIRGCRVFQGQYTTTEQLIKAINESIKQKRGFPTGTVFALRQKHPELDNWYKNVKQMNISKTEPDTYNDVHFSIVNNRTQINRPAHIKSIWFSDTLRTLLGIGRKQSFDKSSETQGHSIPDTR